MQSADAATSTSFEDLPEVQLTNGAHPRFEFPANGTASGNRRRLRSSSITPMQQQQPMTAGGGGSHGADEEERLRELRRAISARPQTSAVIESCDESDDDIRVCDVLEDVDDDDLSFFSDDDGSDFGSRPNFNPSNNPTII